MPTPNLPATLDFAFDGTPIRIITRDGEPWFVLVDVCRVLWDDDDADGDPSKVAGRLDPTERATLPIRGSSSSGIEQSRQHVIVSESGLYAVIMTSRKPAARRFRLWVTGEVLVSIRRTGGYGASADPMALLADPHALRAMLLQMADREIALTEAVTVERSGRLVAEKIAHDAIEDAKPTDCARQIDVVAKEVLFMDRLRDLREYLRAEHMIWPEQRWLRDSDGGTRKVTVWCASQAMLTGARPKLQFVVEDVSFGSCTVRMPVVYVTIEGQGWLQDLQRRGKFARVADNKQKNLRLLTGRSPSSMRH